MNWRAARLRARARRQGFENVNYAPPIIAPLLQSLGVKEFRHPSKAELREQSALAIAQWQGGKITEARAETGGQT
jgi:hypothetical protein